MCLELVQLQFNTIEMKYNWSALALVWNSFPHLSHVGVCVDKLCHLNLTQQLYLIFNIRSLGPLGYFKKWF